MGAYSWKAKLAETMTVWLGSIAFRWATCVYFWARCTRQIAGQCL
jgi:hypothetical protein